MNYQQATEYLDSLQLHTIKLGLGPMREFLGKVGDPHKSLKCIHVAGTNGKGSVCATAVSIFRQADFEVGLYSSPHLSDVRERFCINDRYISEEEFTEQVQIICDVLGEDKITYFECTTAIAFMWFAQQKPDFIMLETGLGGRLDATNVVDPLVSLITNISLDHEAYLGNTIEAVAGEKAGIIKQGVPVVSGCKGVAREVVEKVANSLNSPLFLAERDFTIKTKSNGSMDWQADRDLSQQQLENLTTNLSGSHQADNISLVLALLPLLEKHGFHVTEKQLKKGLNNIFWPGRLETLVAMIDQEAKRTFLLDGGHNPAGVASLASVLEKDYAHKDLILIWAAMSDKDSSKTLPVIAPLVDVIILTKPESKRSAEPETLAKSLNDVLAASCHITHNIEDALAMASKKSNKDSLVVVAGSLYLVGAVREKLVGKLVD